MAETGDHLMFTGDHFYPFGDYSDHNLIFQMVILPKRLNKPTFSSVLRIQSKFIIVSGIDLIWIIKKCSEEELKGDLRVISEVPLSFSLWKREKTLNEVWTKTFFGKWLSYSMTHTVQQGGKDVLSLWFHRCWWRMLVRNYVGDKFEKMMTDW